MSGDPFAYMAGKLANETRAKSWLGRPDVVPLPPGTTRVAAMLALLATGPQTAADLAAGAGGIASAAVSALLVDHIKRGQVTRVGGIYQINRDYDEDLRDRLKTAASLLRAHGYVVRRDGR